MDCGSRTCKPNSVCRFRQDGHSSGPRITARLKRPTRRLWRTEPARFPGEARRLAGRSLPIWSCSVWGLPCPPHYCGGGALLPHLFTLTRALRPGRYVFCGTFRRLVSHPCAKNAQEWATPSRTLSGTLLCGVRTFLCFSTATVRSGCQQIHYSAGRECRQIVPADSARRMACSLLLGREEERVD
jgi:hypothetical protein